MIDYKCMQCNTLYSRKCDFMKHFKKLHDTTCDSYNSYLVNYVYKTHPICEYCNINKVIVRRDIISSYCPECTKILTSNQLRESARTRFDNPIKKADIISKRKKTTLIKYGVDHISKSDIIKHKKQNTIYNRYAVNSIMDIPSIKEARLAALETNKQLINDKRRSSWNSNLVSIANTHRAETNNLRYNTTYPTKLAEIKHKISTKAKLRYSSIEYKTKCINNLLKKYNVINISQLNAVQQLIKLTSFKRYNSSYYLGSELRRQREEIKGNWIPLKLITEFDRYHRSCIIETRKHIKQLLATWNGVCYYTNILLVTDKNKYNHPLYRTIDHKISIYDGFMSNTDPSIIGNLSNLCICSRAYNSTKGISSHAKSI